MSIRHASRFFPLLAGAALVLAACGSGDSVVTSGPDGTADDGTAALRAPTPIQVVGGGSGGEVAATANAESDDMAAESSMLVPIGNIEYVIGAGLGDLPTDDTGYVFEGGATPAIEQVEALAAALGVNGEVIEVSDEYQRSWRVGPDDGSAPSVWVYGDAMLGWSYNSAWADEEAFECVSRGSSGSAGGGETVDAVEVDPEGPVDDVGDIEGEGADEDLPVVVEPECDAPEPPSGVPTAAEAEDLASALLADLGVSTDGIEFETYADEWFANVEASRPGDPAGAARRWSFGFGADASLQFAGGSLAEPIGVGPYPLVDLDTALARLNEGGFWYGGYAGGLGIAEPAIAVESEIAVSEPVDDIAVEEPVSIDEPMPVDPVEPEDITITLVDVQSDLWWAWDADESVWLLPAYRFIDADGGWHVVPAVTDEFIIQVEPDIEPVPAPEPLPADGSTEPAPAPPDTVVGDAAFPAELQEMMAQPVDEFTIVAESLGFVVRIVAEDGEFFAVTEDFVENRINVETLTRDGMALVINAFFDGGSPFADTSGIDVNAWVEEQSAGEIEPAPLSIAEVYEGVAFYPACGNEQLVHDGITWYQVQSGDYPEIAMQIFEVPRNGLEEDLLGTDSQPTGFAGAPRVAEPGPGDDTGTLVIWEDGFARWVSDSGDLVAWLVQTELSYGWEC